MLPLGTAPLGSGTAVLSGTTQHFCASWDECYSGLGSVVLVLLRAPEALLCPGGLWSVASSIWSAFRGPAQGWHLWSVTHFLQNTSEQLPFPSTTRVFFPRRSHVLPHTSPPVTICRPFSVSVTSPDTLQFVSEPLLQVEKLEYDLLDARVAGYCLSQSECIWDSVELVSTLYFL